MCGYPGSCWLNRSGVKPKNLHFQRYPGETATHLGTRFEWRLARWSHLKGFCGAVLEIVHNTYTHLIKYHSGKRSHLPALGAGKYGIILSWEKRKWVFISSWWSLLHVAISSYCYFSLPQAHEWNKSSIYSSSYHLSIYHQFTDLDSIPFLSRT